MRRSSSGPVLRGVLCILSAADTAGLGEDLPFITMTQACNCCSARGVEDSSSVAKLEMMALGGRDALRVMMKRSMEDAGTRLLVLLADS